MLPAVQDETFSAQKWEQHARTLLLKTLPNETKLIQKIRITIIDDRCVVAEARVHEKTVFITRGCLLLVKSEEEFAALLAHELAHIKRRHVSVSDRIWVPYGEWQQLSLWIAWRYAKLRRRRSLETFEEYLEERDALHEIEADQFAALSLPPSMHPAKALADILERIGSMRNMWQESLSPVVRMHRRRIQLLRQMAQQETSRTL